MDFLKKNILWIVIGLILVALGFKLLKDKDKPFSTDDTDSNKPISEGSDDGNTRNEVKAIQKMLNDATKKHNSQFSNGFGFDWMVLDLLEEDGYFGSLTSARIDFFVDNWWGSNENITVSELEEELKEKGWL